MSVFIDIIGAAVIGVMVIMTILFTIFNVQRMNYNVNTMLTLNTTANTLTEVIDMSYLEPVARHLQPEQPAIILAQRDQFTFNRRHDNPPHNLQTYQLRMLRNADDNIFLSVMRTEGGIATEVFNSFPFFFESGDVFTFFDLNGNVTTDTDLIRGVRVDLVFVADSFGRDDSRISYPITFWRHFKNIYLRSFTEIVDSV